MNIETISENFSKEQHDGLSRFAFWNNILFDNGDEELNIECGSCGSFCSGGTCTACTSILGETYITKSMEKYMN